jgi:transposase-like protein
VRLTVAEKREVIRLVEESDLSVRQTLQELGVNRATFYAWYRRYQAQENKCCGSLGRAPSLIAPVRACAVLSGARDGPTLCRG